MNKQEQIEEMVGVMAASNNPFVDVPIEIMPQVAEALYNAGYRKADEVRKETAKKIFDALYQWLDLENIEKLGFVTIQKFDFLQKFREIYKQFDVGIKE